MKRTWIRRIGVACLLAVAVAGYYVCFVPNAELAPHLRSLRHAGQLTVREGLPHERYEHELLESELRTKQTIENHGFPFYAKSQVISSDDVSKIKRILLNPWAYRGITPNTTKSCGGYHPDYAVEWTDSDGKRQIQLCFGCLEVKLYDADSEANYDLSHWVSHPLQVIFKRYRDQRPPINLGGPFLELN
ncbi:MAG: hypothetical protein JWM11_2453 [Planctomycetaceae bacterium]|nr:hypothetical protein [Planctomycetaceae bacterium]